MLKKLIVLGVLGVTAIILLIQLIPYGRAHANPPVVKEPQWNTPETRSLAVRACFDCHSNETVWPWYSSVAPFSWLIQRDVDEGRGRLNFSAWGQLRIRRVGEIGEVIMEGEMPPWYYVIQHPTAGLSAAEKQALVDGLLATLNR
jgi:hypothetical protein